MMTRVVGCETDDLEIGMPLEVVFEAVSVDDRDADSGEPVVLAFFRPAAA